MTVGIAARSIGKNDPVIVACMDMMGSTPWNSSETLLKWHIFQNGFRALLAGPAGTARELADHCESVLDLNSNPGVPQVLRMLRQGIGLYKRAFAEAHLQSRMGMTYQDFKTDGKAILPSDLYREVFWEIKRHSSDAELIVCGFLRGSPRIFKVSQDTVWYCDDFAVIGTGTAIGESSLYFRSQSPITDFETTVYQVYEAKRLAENAPGVGKKTILLALRPGAPVGVLSAIGFQEIGKLLEQFAPRGIAASDSFPDGSFDPTSL